MNTVLSVIPITSPEGRVASAEVYGGNHTSIGSIIVLSKHTWIARFTDPKCRFGCTTKGACGSQGPCKNPHVQTFPTALAAAIWVWEQEYSDFPESVRIPDWYAALVEPVAGNTTTKRSSHVVDFIEPTPYTEPTPRQRQPKTRKEAIVEARTTVDQALTQALTDVLGSKE